MVTVPDGNSTTPVRSLPLFLATRSEMSADPVPVASDVMSIHDTRDETVHEQ